MKISQLFLIAALSIGVSSAASKYERLASLPNYLPYDFDPKRLVGYIDDVRAGEHTSTPLEYNVTIHPEPDQKSFTASATIRFRANIESDNITLQAEDLTSLSASFVDYPDPFKRTIITLSKGPGYLNIKFSNNVQEGEIYVLSIHYRGVISSKGNKGGLIDLKKSDQSNSPEILYTAFGVGDIGKVFPCIDNPSINARFNFNLIHPKKYAVITSAQKMTAQPSSENRRGNTSFSYVPGIAAHQASFALLCGYDPLDTVKYANIRIDGYLPKKKQRTKVGKALKEVGQVFKTLQKFFKTTPPFEKITVVFAQNYNNAARIKTAGNLLVLDYYDVTSSAYLYNLKRKCLDMWLNAITSVSSLEDAWIKEALVVWITENILYNGPSDKESRPSFIDNKEHIMALDFLDGRGRLNYPYGQYSNGGQAYSTKCLMLMLTLEEHLLKDKLILAIRQFVADSANGTMTKDSFINGLSKFDSKFDPQAVSQIINPWISLGGLPVVTITKRNGSELTVESSLQGLRATQISDTSFIPVHVDLYMGNNFHRTILLRQKINTIMLNVAISPPFVVFEPKPYTYFRLSYSDEYLQELAQAGRSGAMSREEKVKLFESLKDSPSSIILLANEWKDDKSSRLLTIHALNMLLPYCQKEHCFQIRKLQQYIARRLLLDLNYSPLNGKSDIRQIHIQFSHIDKWSEAKLSALNEACVLGIPEYRFICLYLTVQYNNARILPPSLAFGSFKETLGNASVTSDNYETIIDIVEDADEPWHYRVAAAKALGVSENTNSSTFLHTVKKVISADHGVDLFTQMFETMRMQNEPAQKAWNWIRKNWNRDLRRNSKLRKAITSSGVTGWYAFKKSNQVCRFFRRTKSLSLMERISLNHNIAITTQSTVLTIADKNRMGMFLNSSIEDPSSKGATAAKEANVDMRVQWKPASFVRKYQSSLSCQVPLIR